MIRKTILGLIITAASIAVFVGGNAAIAGSADKGDSKAAQAPSASTTVVISQLYGAGGNTGATYTTDYIELKNISGSTQSIGGFALQYGSATGQFGGSTGTNIVTLPSVSLAPGQYYLVALAGGANGGPLPVAADFTSTAINMSGSSGKIALTPNGTWLNCGATATPCTFTSANVVDWAAFGAAGNGPSGNGEGGTSVNNNTAMTATQMGVRKGGGCTDTDNNNLDFDVITAAVPRNTATTAAPCSATPAQNIVDFNGDGKTDFAVVRNTGGGPSGQITWFVNYASTATTVAYAWGISGDFFVPVDFDGDQKTDIAIWRAGAPTVAAFYILQSGTNTVRVEAFGQTGDDPSVVDDYNGDGKADLAVYRAGANAGDQSTWFYRSTANGPVTYMPWGQNGDFPAPGDYDGDGKADFGVQRNNGGGQARFWRMQTTAGADSVVFGTPTDVIVPGDYDGDGKTDIAVVRGSAGQYAWFVLPSSTGTISATPYAVFGASATDFVAQGDYDGDGKTDVAVWRPSASVGASAFWFLGSTSGATGVPFGQNGDYPVANYNRH